MLNITRKSALAAASAGAIALFGTFAGAATVTSENLSSAELTALIPTSVTPTANSDWSAAPSIVNGSVSNVTRTPFEDLGAAGNAVDYYSVAGGSSATLQMKSTARMLSFLWGSVDGYNAVTLYNDADGTSKVFTSADLGDPDAPANAASASYVSISGFLFDRAVFSSGQNALEFSNVAAVVPLPAGGLLLLSALGGIAALRRRKKA